MSYRARRGCEEIEDPLTNTGAPDDLSYVPPMLFKDVLETLPGEERSIDD